MGLWGSGEAMRGGGDKGSQVTEEAGLREEEGRITEAEPEHQGRPGT